MQPMRRHLIILGLVLLAGCSHPDKVVMFKSPTEGLFYTVEEYHAGGPVSDTDRVYAHFESHGKASKMLVLEGGNLTITALRWTSPEEVTLCIDGGIADTFRNQVTLFAGESSVTVKNHLDERCNEGPASLKK
jgi:hypothetical protein